MVDALAIGSHSDDCELFMGGTLALLTGGGYDVAIADLTRAELASRGTPDERRKEAGEAAKILGVSKRLQLDLGDGRIGLEPDHRREVVRLLRAERPTIVFSHHPDDRHPDHERASQLVREACFFSNVAGCDTGQERFRPLALIEFIGNPKGAPPAPAFVVPIGETFDRKIEALRAYKSQFHNPQYAGPETLIGSKLYFEQIEARARYWGTLIGENYGEVFCYGGLLTVRDPVGFFKEAGGK